MGDQVKWNTNQWQKTYKGHLKQHYEPTRGKPYHEIEDTSGPLIYTGHLQDSRQNPINMVRWSFVLSLSSYFLFWFLKKNSLPPISNKPQAPKNLVF